jgi:hypothetical protein
MRIFDLRTMSSRAYDEAEKNVFYPPSRVKASIIELSARGSMPTCEIASH